MEENRVKQLLEGKGENYLYPFFWQHGQTKEVLETYVDKIKEMGIGAVCIESRPHPDFLGEGWWRDIDIILARAEELGMKVWILDDSHFPTGFANGRIKKADDFLKRCYLFHREMDIAGPVHGGRIAVKPQNGSGILEGEEELVCAVLVRRKGEENFASDGMFTELTNQIEEGWLKLDVPEGRYRLYFVVKSLQSAKEFNDYIDMTNPGSVDLLLEEVYEKHYEKYVDKFGTVITGFFSDEPGFYNYSSKNGFSFRLQIGSDMPIPWNEEIACEWEKAVGKEYCRKYLPALWFDCGPNTEQIRACYMELLTNLYQKNFTGRIADWCHNHGVEYVGHIIEDNNCHARLGPSCGHYFRALSGQDMSGIDVVLQQILPQMDYCQYGMSARGTQDGSFNFYGLAKLGASMAHLDAKTKGRAMCEIFGAYGWAEGIGLMKWLVDHMLVRGINVFVPHAFSEKEFPDKDCPPHFYAHGKNPQHGYMGTLFTYMNRMCHILSGGHSGVKTAVLYHAESEWLGRSMYFHTIGRELLKAQTDYDVVSLDFLEKSRIEGGRIRIGEMVFEKLFIPFAEYYPEKLKYILRKCRKSGVKVIQVTGELPKDSRTGKQWDWKNTEGEILEDTEQIPLDRIKEYVKTQEKENLRFCADTESVKVAQWLRRYHYIHRDGTNVYLFFNESTVCSLTGTIHQSGMESLFVYDAFKNKIKECPADENGKIKILLEPGEMQVYLSENLDFLSCTSGYRFNKVTDIWQILNEKTEVYLADYREQENFRYYREFTNNEWPDISEELPQFAGIIRYKTTFEIPPGQNLKKLRIEKVREGVQLWINGQSAGICIGNPYCYDVENLALPGKNTICIETATTLVPIYCDVFSRNMVLQQEGIMGPIMFLTSK